MVVIADLVSDGGGAPESCHVFTKSTHEKRDEGIVAGIKFWERTYNKVSGLIFVKVLIFCFLTPVTACAASNLRLNL